MVLKNGLTLDRPTTHHSQAARPTSSTGPEQDDSEEAGPGRRRHRVINVLSLAANYVNLDRVQIQDLKFKGVVDNELDLSAGDEHAVDRSPVHWKENLRTVKTTIKAVAQPRNPGIAFISIVALSLW
ncbi:hypothetical protein E4T47_06482 [Aureobasidium subglaciale]|nr:hypothetical protein E4T47_06482 [Aureobasidium subglaciale]